MPEPTLSYQRLEHKSDTGFLVRAPSVQRLYIYSALALTDMMVKLSQIQEKEAVKVKLSADDKEGLMVRWLNEILFLFEQRKYLAHRIVFHQFDVKNISATLYGETYDPIRHGSISEIKAVTYHQLEIGQSTNGEDQFFAKIFLDL